MKKIKLLSSMAATVIALGALASCGDGREVIKIGLHANLGAGAGYSAVAQGFFEEELKDLGYKVEYQIGGGPDLATKLIQNQIQVSFMGGGVAGYYFRTEQPIKIAALDNLTNDDRLIAVKGGKGDALTLTSTVEEYRNALKGATLALDLDKTPKDFLNSSLIPYLNNGLEDADKVWYNTGDTDTSKARFPLGLTTYTDANEIKIKKMTNNNITTSIKDAGDADFVIAFAPVSTSLETNTETFRTVVTTATHFKDSYTPSTWGVNTAWLKDHEEVFQAFMNGLVKGMNFRRDHITETFKDIEELSGGQVSAKSLSGDIAVWLGGKEQLEMKNDGRMTKYTENIRTGKQGTEGVDPAITVEKATCFEYLLNAAEANK